MPITLLDLPVYPRFRDEAGFNEEESKTGSIIVDTYMKEMDCINKDNIKAFVERWKNIWLLTGAPYHESVDDLINGNYDVDKVLFFLERKKDEDLDVNDPNFAIMMNLALPGCFAEAFFIAKKWIVGVDAILVRKYLDPYPELDGELR